MRLQSRTRLGGAVAIALGVALVGAGVPSAALANDCDVDPATETVTTAASVDAPLTQLFGHYGDTAGRWTGADSAYSVALPGGRTAWLYSDTFLGAVNADHSRPQDAPFIHNSIVVTDKSHLSTYTGGTDAAPASLVAVPGADEGQKWFWFGDGTVEGSHLRVSLLEFAKTGTGQWDFAFDHTAVASFSLPSMRFEGITNRPAGLVEWGSAIYEDHGYTYIYGVEDLGATKYLHLARVKSGQLTTGAWEYLGATGWTGDEAASKRIMDGVANEFSVTSFQGKYTLVTSDATEPLSTKIVMYRSDSLEGPFVNKTVLYQTPETAGNVFTYNAKAHPELGSDGRLLVTYNVNSFDTADVYKNVDNYRPRYVDVAVKIAPAGGSCVHGGSAGH